MCLLSIFFLKLIYKQEERMMLPGREGNVDLLLVAPLLLVVAHGGR